jgi:deoxycytidylate deaminase
MTAHASTDLRAVEDPTRPELVIGLIGALGAQIDDVERDLRERLEKLGYRIPPTIKLSELLHELTGPAFDRLRTESGNRAHVSHYMDAGNELRALTGRSEAMAMLGVNQIRQFREEMSVPESRTADATAFIINSLKHPAEVQALRTIYGPCFVAIAIFNNREERIEATERRLFDHAGRIGKAKLHRSEAERLIERDEDEQGLSHGQHVSDAFALADVVVAKSGRRDLTASVKRFIDLFFGDWRYTPTSGETSMYHAQGACYRSSSMARQVGAAIVRSDGSIVATGMNDVPKAKGGLYGDLDDPDARDHARADKQDSSDFHKRSVVIDLFERMLGLGLLNVTESSEIVPVVDQLVTSKALKGTKMMATIDYVRAVHAEMAALMDAARHGQAVGGCTLYTTTFPCHDCTKHIVAAGIDEVVFVEPYTKSLASELFADSVAIDDPASGGKVRFAPFIGVLPRRYADLFRMHGERKTVDGMWKEWTPQEARPILGDYVPPSRARIVGEEVAIGQFNILLTDRALVRSPTAP